MGCCGNSILVLSNVCSGNLPTYAVLGACMVRRDTDKMQRILHMGTNLHACKDVSEVCKAELGLKYCSHQKTLNIVAMT